MHHTGLKQKLGGPEAQGSSHEGHGCHSKGGPHKTPAAKESTLAEAGRGLGTQGMSAPVCSPSPISWALRSSGHAGGTQALHPPQHSLRALHTPPPLLYSCFALLPPLQDQLPHPERPTSSITVSRRLNLLPHLPLAALHQPHSSVTDRVGCCLRSTFW